MGDGSFEVRARWPGVIERAEAGVRVATYHELVKDGAGRRMLDLGAGPCHFAKVADSEGWEVTAVDARTVRLPEDLGDIRFVEADVREADVAGYDCITMLGLLYHLPLADQRDLLSRCSYTDVILETQVHTPGYVPVAAEPWGHHEVEEDGYEGVVFPEGDNPMASIGNPTSLWLTEPSLLRLFSVCGYGSVELVEPMHHSKYGTRRFFVLHPADRP